MTDITWYVASTKGYLQSCKDLQHALKVLRECEKTKQGLGSFYLMRTPDSVAADSKGH